MVGQKKKPKLMLYSTLVEIEVEVGVELGNNLLYVTEAFENLQKLFCVLDV